MAAAVLINSSRAAELIFFLLCGAVALVAVKFSSHGLELLGSGHGGHLQPLRLVTIIGAAGCSKCIELSRADLPCPFSIACMFTRSWRSIIAQARVTTFCVACCLCCDRDLKMRVSSDLRVLHKGVHRSLTLRFYTGSLSEKPLQLALQRFVGFCACLT